MLGKTNVRGSVTGSQGFGGEGLLRGWIGFVLMDSWLCRFLPVFLLRKDAVHLQILTPFLQASDGLWYEMEDDFVGRCDIDTVLSQQAYLLFYVR